MQEKFLRLFWYKAGALPWGTQLYDFWRGSLGAWIEGEEQGALGPWWQESQLPTADRFTDITLRACADIYPTCSPQRMEVSLSSFRPSPPKGLAIFETEPDASGLIFRPRTDEVCCQARR